MIYYMYRRDQIEIYNTRRLQHWFDIFTQVMKKVQFVPVLRLIERHDVQKEKNEMLQLQMKSQVDRDKTLDIATNILKKKLKYSDDRVHVLK